MERRKYVDLHMHSHYSDGITDPRTLIRSSVLRGIEVIALDAGCGMGYGTYILACEARKVIGLEFCSGLADLARKHWSFEGKTSFWPCEICSEPLPEGFTVCVALESIEHLFSPEMFLARLPPDCLLVGSVPNEAVRPYAKHENPHHKCHYTPGQIEDLIGRCGFDRTGSWWSQDFDQMYEGVDGRTIIFTAKKTRDGSVDLAELSVDYPRQLTDAILERNNKILSMKKGL